MLMHLHVQSGFYLGMFCLGGGGGSLKFWEGS